MKITLVVLGIGLTALAALFEAHPEIEVPIGYFLVASTALLAAALWRNEPEDGKGYRAVQKVYGVLASGPMEMSELVKTLAGEGYSASDWKLVYRETIGRMLSEGQLVIENGAVAVPKGT